MNVKRLISGVASTCNLDLTHNPGAGGRSKQHRCGLREEEVQASQDFAESNP